MSAKKPKLERAEQVTIRLYPTEEKLAYKLKAYHGLASIGRLFGKLMRDNVQVIKKESSQTGQ